jgi:hypothetical protein
MERGLRSQRYQKSHVRVSFAQRKKAEQSCSWLRARKAESAPEIMQTSNVGGSCGGQGHFGTNFNASRQTRMARRRESGHFRSWRS